jgi:hypothetical protein
VSELVWVSVIESRLLSVICEALLVSELVVLEHSMLLLELEHMLPSVLKLRALMVLQHWAVGVGAVAGGEGAVGVVAVSVVGVELADVLGDPSVL